MAAPTPWVEKYRPRTVLEVASQDEVTQALRSSVSAGSLPHLLFFGPPGTGKTSTIVALARDLFGPALFRQRVLELNASDERGISVVREKVKAFASTAVAKHAPGPGGKPAPPFKLIILDEADAMTGDAQAALRRTMEKYTRVTRFCLVCNYVSRIIEPLASRCAKFRFRPLPREPMLARIKTVCDAEGVQMDAAAKDALLEVAGGDMRRAITLLQCAAQFNALIVDRAVMLEVSGTLPPDALDQLWSAVEGDKFNPIADAIRDVVAQGYSATMMLGQLSSRAMANAPTGETAGDDVARAKMLLKLASTDKSLADGADEEMQLLDTCATFATVIKEAKRMKAAS